METCRRERISLSWWWRQGWSGLQEMSPEPSFETRWEGHRPNRPASWRSSKGAPMARLARHEQRQLCTRPTVVRTGLVWSGLALLLSACSRSQFGVRVGALGAQCQEGPADGIVDSLTVSLRRSSAGMVGGIVATPDGCCSEWELGCRANSVGPVVTEVSNWGGGMEPSETPYHHRRSAERTRDGC